MVQSGSENIASNSSSNKTETDKTEIEQFIGNCYSEVADYSKEISTICRQLAFAEGGLFWYAKTEHFNVSNGFIFWCLVCLLCYFFFDAAQYIAGMCEYKKLSDKYHDDFEKHKNYDTEHYKIPSKNCILMLFFILKLLSISLSSGLLIWTYYVGLYSS